MTFLIGPEAQGVFFRANDEELSPKEAYKFMVPIFGPGVVYDSSTDVMYEQLKFAKGGLVPAQLKRDVGYMLAIIDRFAKESWKSEGNQNINSWRLESVQIARNAFCLWAFLTTYRTVGFCRPPPPPAILGVVDDMLFDMNRLTILSATRW
jgi:sterol 14-demethylase